MLISKFNYTKINRASVAGKRHYCLPDGSQVPSVTTILEATKPEEDRRALQEWRRRVGTAKAQEITTEAAGRGTRMHKWLENYVSSGTIGEPGTNPYSQQSYIMAQTIIDQGLGPNVTEFWGIEVPVYYSGLYAGTTDCVGSWRDKPAILDFKQSNKLKKREWIDSYFLQLCAYALAHNHTHGTNIAKGVILMCTADGIYQEFIIEGEDFENYTHQWLGRVELYYQNQR